MQTLFAEAIKYHAVTVRSASKEWFKCLKSGLAFISDNLSRDGSQYTAVIP